MRSVIYLIINVETLFGVSDAPGLLEGFGPISAVQARALAAGPDTVFYRLLVTPTGNLVYADPRAYRIPAARACLLECVSG